MYCELWVWAISCPWVSFVKESMMIDVQKIKNLMSDIDNKYCDLDCDLEVAQESENTEHEASIKAQMSTMRDMMDKVTSMMEGLVS